MDRQKYLPFLLTLTVNEEYSSSFQSYFAILDEMMYFPNHYYFWIKAINTCVLVFRSMTLLCVDTWSKFYYQLMQLLNNKFILFVRVSKKKNAFFILVF